MEKELATGALGAKGSERVQQRLLNYLQGGRIHPALLLVGAEREVKQDVAKNMAKFLLCEQKTPQKTFCGVCSACRRIEKELHPDVLFLKEEEEDTIKIDTVRELCHQMEVSSMEGGAKVCVIWECHRMNAASANAFLKTLEEPGAGRYFILLTTQVGSLLPTILSRCLQFTFKPEREAYVLDAETTQKYTQLTEGVTQKGAVPELLAALPEKENCFEYLRFLQDQLRASLLAFDNTSTAKSELFSSFSPYALLDAFEGAVKLEGRLRSNANYALMLESFLSQHIQTETT